MSRGQMANANGKCKWQMANGRSGGWKGIKLGTAAEDGSQMNARCFFLVPFFFFFPTVVVNPLSILFYFYFLFSLFATIYFLLRQCNLQAQHFVFSINPFLF